MVASQTADPEADTFRGLLLRHRGRTGLTQRDLAVRAGTSRRSIQDWESGVYYPSAERLQALTQVLLDSGGLSVGHERDEAAELWATARREAPRMHTPFDTAWFDRLLAERPPPHPSPAPAGAVTRAVAAVSSIEIPAVERRQDWGEAPDVAGFVGRADEPAGATCGPATHQGAGQRVRAAESGAPDRRAHPPATGGRQWP